MLAQVISLVRALLPVPAPAAEEGEREEREKKREEAGELLWDLSAVPVHASFLAESAMLPEVGFPGPALAASMLHHFVWFCCAQRSRLQASRPGFQAGFRYLQADLCEERIEAFGARLAPSHGADKALPCC